MLEKFWATSGTITSSVKKTITTAIHRYMEQRTPNKLENLRALAFLGIDIGNKIQYVKSRPQNFVPVSLLRMKWAASGL